MLFLAVSRFLIACFQMHTRFASLLFMRMRVYDLPSLRPPHSYIYFAFSLTILSFQLDLIHNRSASCLGILLPLLSFLCVRMYTFLHTEQYVCSLFFRICVSQNETVLRAVRKCRCIKCTFDISRESYKRNLRREREREGKKTHMNE